jgi:hypothetical protein
VGDLSNDQEVIMNSRRTAMLAVSGAAAVLLTAGLVAQAVGGADPTSSPSPSVSSTDDNGGELDRDLRFEPGDDRDVNGTGTPSTSTPGASRTDDDNGGQLDRDLRFEPGDDRDVNGSGTAGTAAHDDDDDSGQGPTRSHGGDDRDSDDHDSDDHDSDDHGSGGHGSDDD